MLKILYLFENLRIGGAEQLLLTTLKYLDRDKFYPIVYCISEKGAIAKEAEVVGIKVKSLNKKADLLSFGIIIDLIREFKKEKPDILHTHLFRANYFGRIAAFFSGVPVVLVTEHGTISNFKKFYHHFIDYLLSFSTDKIIAVSCAVKKYILKNNFIPAQKLVVLYNAVDADRFAEVNLIDKAAIRKNMGFTKSDFLIGCISNLAPWKGQLVLLRAFAEINNKVASARICIVGRSEKLFQNQLEEFARKNSFSEKVTFLGERRDVPELLKAFDVFVFPSLTEGLGISLLEAMYMGLPVVASKTEGIIEVVEDGKDGFLFKPGDYRELASVVLMLINDYSRGKYMGANAAKKVRERFSPGVYIDGLQHIYTESINKKYPLNLKL